MKLLDIINKLQGLRQKKEKFQHLARENATKNDNLIGLTYLYKQ